MKKLYAAILTAVMAIAFVVPTVASPSPNAEIVEAASQVSTTVAGTTMTSQSTDFIQHVVTDIQDAPAVLADLGVSTSAKVASVLDVTYAGEIPAGGVQIPFVISSAKAGDYVYILHRKDDVEGKPWEVVGEAKLDATLTATGTFTSFSPVAFMVVNAADVASGAVSPKTGE